MCNKKSFPLEAVSVYAVVKVPNDYIYVGGPAKIYYLGFTSSADFISDNLPRF